MAHKFMNLKTNKPFNVTLVGKRQIESQKNWRKNYDYLGEVKDEAIAAKSEPADQSKQFEAMRSENEEIIKAKREFKAAIGEFEKNREEYQAEREIFEQEKESFESEKAQFEADKLSFEELKKSYTMTSKDEKQADDKKKK